MSTAADRSSVHPDTGTVAGTDTSTDTGVAGDCILTPGTAPISTSPADRFMRRLLRLPEGGPSVSADEARSLFQKSLLISATRCLLMYIVFPFVLPVIGLAKGVGPYIGLVIGLLAMVAIVYSIRRFWRANHSKRWHYTIFGTTIIGFLIVLAVKDITTIFS